MKRKYVLVIAAIVGLALLALGLGGCGGAVGEPGAEEGALGAEDIATTPPNAPSNLGAVLTAIYDVHVTWHDNSVDEDGFIVTHV